VDYPLWDAARAKRIYRGVEMIVIRERAR